MIEKLTDRLGKPAEIVRARSAEPRNLRCPWCLTRAMTAGHFFVGAVDTDGRAFPFCRRCLDRDAPSLAKVVRGLNALAESVGALEWKDIRAVNNVLHYIMREAFAEMPEDLRRREAEAGRPAVGRAVRAMVSRQVHEVTEISVVETVDTADVYSVIEALSTIIAASVRETVNSDPTWLERCFDGFDESGDETP